MESLFAGSSDFSDTSGLLEDDGDENFYQMSIVSSTIIKRPEDLIDKDLINLLRYVKRLPETTLDHLTSKRVEFGDYIRHKTLIWDLDETLVHT
jgi:hypothetical protein